MSGFTLNSGVAIGLRVIAGNGGAIHPGGRDPSRGFPLPDIRALENGGFGNAAQNCPPAG